MVLNYILVGCSWTSSGAKNFHTTRGKIFSSFFLWYLHLSDLLNRSTISSLPLNIHRHCCSYHHCQPHCHHCQSWSPSFRLCNHACSLVANACYQGNTNWNLSSFLKRASLMCSLWWHFPQLRGKKRNKSIESYQEMKKLNVKAGKAVSFVLLSG